MSTELHKLKAGDRFVIDDPEANSDVYVYSGRIDGMYGSCKHELSGTRCLLAAWTPTKPAPGVPTHVGPLVPELGEAAA